MPRPLDLPEPYAAGTFAVAAATRDGAKMSSLRALANPYRGVRSHTLPTTLVERVEALRTVRRDGFALSHCTAAALHGLPVPRGCGQRVTTLVDTWLGLAPLLTLDELVVVGDAVARRLESVAPLVAGPPRARTHRQRVREALRWVRVGSASPMETRSRVLFVRGGLPEPELNVPIFDAQGGWLAEGDLVWRESRTARGRGMAVRRLHQGRLLPPGPPHPTRRARGCSRGRPADAGAAGRGRPGAWPVGVRPRALPDRPRRVT